VELAVRERVVESRHEDMKDSEGSMSVLAEYRRAWLVLGRKPGTFGFVDAFLPLEPLTALNLGLSFCDRVEDICLGSVSLDVRLLLPLATPGP
jgi:hypothetical protein